MTNYSPDSDSYQHLEPHNAVLVSPRGNRVSVNISPEAAVVWTRYGFRVEWLPVLKAVA